MSADPADFSYSVVIPVYNSQDVVGRTIDAVLEVTGLARGVGTPTSTRRWSIRTDVTAAARGSRTNLSEGNPECP